MNPKYDDFIYDENFIPEDYYPDDYEGDRTGTIIDDVYNDPDIIWDDEWEN